MYISPWMQALLIPKRWDVCGVIVAPLSLWHVYILRTANNPYLCGGACDKNAAAEVLMYTCGGVEHGNRIFNNAKYRNRWHKRIHKKLAKRKWEDVDAAILEYVTETTRTPGHKQIKKTSDGVEIKTASAPREWVMVEYIATRNGGDMQAAWDSPYAEITCVFDAGRDIRGDDTTLISEQDEERIDKKLEKMRAA